MAHTCWNRHEKQLYCNNKGALNYQRPFLMLKYLQSDRAMVAAHDVRINDSLFYRLL